MGIPCHGSTDDDAYSGWAGSVDDQDLRTEDPKQPGFLEMRDAAGLLFAIIE